MNRNLLYAVAATALCMSLGSCTTKANKEAATTEQAATAAIGNAEQVNPLLVGKRWKLTELNGQAVKTDAYIEFSKEGNRVSGNLGCNTFTATYERTLRGGMKFAQVATTQKACFNATVEDEFKKVINTADNYIVDAKSLTLNRARMAPLAKFEAEKE
jgi:heat shock protein HslJ